MSFDVGTGLSPEARSIIDAARAGEDPSAEDVARVRSRVFAHLGVGLATGAAATLVAASTAEAAATTAAATTTAVATTTAATSTVATSGAAAAVATTATTAGLFAKMTLATKVGVAVLALGTATSGVVVATRAASPPADAPIAQSAPLPASEPGSRARPPVAATPPPPAAEPSPAVSADAAEPEASPRIAPPETAPAARASAPAPSALPAIDPVAEEADLLGRAQSALAAGRHAEALAMLDEHAQRFPRGVLAHEREGARWLALCGSGRADAARPAVSAFLAQNPSSPLAARLRAACGIDR